MGLSLIVNLAGSTRHSLFSLSLSLSLSRSFVRSLSRYGIRHHRRRKLHGWHPWTEPSRVSTRIRESIVDGSWDAERDIEGYQGVCFR